MWCGVVWCGVVWCGVVWCGVVWCGVVWCGVVWCGVVWCGVVWCGVAWRGVVWCGVVWCGVVWCGVVWCGVVWCAEGAVTKKQWPGWSCRQVMQAGRAVCVDAGCVLCVVHLCSGPAGSIHGRPGDSLPLCLLVQLQLPHSPRHGPSSPAQAFMRPSPALVWASQTFCDSNSICRMNSVPMSCGPTSPRRAAPPAPSWWAGCTCGRPQGAAAGQPGDQGQAEAWLVVRPPRVLVWCGVVWCGVVWCGVCWGIIGWSIQQTSSPRYNMMLAQHTTTLQSSILLSGVWDVELLYTPVQGVGY